MSQRSYRYYLSVSHQIPGGLAFATMDVTLNMPISNQDQVQTLTNQLSDQGYQQPVILGFSLYADSNGGGNV